MFARLRLGTPRNVPCAWQMRGKAFTDMLICTRRSQCGGFRTLGVGRQIRQRIDGILAQNRK